MNMNICLEYNPCNTLFQTTKCKRLTVKLFLIFLCTLSNLADISGHQLLQHTNFVTKLLGNWWLWHCKCINFYIHIQLYILTRSFSNSSLSSGTLEGICWLCWCLCAFLYCFWAEYLFDGQILNRQSENLSIAYYTTGNQETLRMILSNIVKTYILWNTALLYFLYFYYEILTSRYEHLK